MYQRMSRCTPLDLSQAVEVATLEIASPMLELPERRVWRPRVEDIADYKTD